MPPLFVEWGEKGETAGVAGGRGSRGGGVLPGTFSQIPLLFSSLPWFSATLRLPVPHSLKGEHNTTNKPFSHGVGAGGTSVCASAQPGFYKRALDKGRFCSISSLLLLFYCPKKGNESGVGTDCGSYLGWSLETMERLPAIRISEFPMQADAAQM